MNMPFTYYERTTISSINFVREYSVAAFPKKREIALKIADKIFG